MSYISPQELREASIDAGTLEKFALGGVGEPNVNRAGDDVLNLATINVRAQEVARQAANMQTYLTYDSPSDKRMVDDVSQPVGTIGRVTSDSDSQRNGDYAWSGSQWIWSSVQPAGRQDVEELRRGVDELNASKVDGISTQSPGILISLVDADGRETFLTARDSDGAPSDFAAQLIGLVLGILFHPVPGYLYALTDSEGRMTDLSIRSSDGQFDDFVVDRLARRVAQRLDPWETGEVMHYPQVRGSSHDIAGGDYYMRAGELLPVLTNMSLFAGWGSSSMQRSSSYFAGLASEFGASYYNGGVGGQRTEHISARIGSIPAVCTFPDNVIPAGTEEVSVDVPEISWHAGQDYTGVVNGVHGRLRYSGGPKFSRTTAGSAVYVDPKTPFLPDEGGKNRAAVNFLWMGRNDLTGPQDKTESCIKNTDKSFDWIAPLVKRVLVLGHFKGDLTPESQVWDRIERVNTAHRLRYGRLFVDINAYLVSPQVWTDMGITPSQQDLDEQAVGTTPTSLRADGLHLTSAAYQAVVTYCVRARMIELGWFYS